MRLIRRAPLLLLAGLTLLLEPRLDARQTASIFDDTTLREVRLLVNSRDLARLRENYLLNTYYPADLIVGNTRVRNVAIRSRGSGSRNPNKLGLRVDFDRYARGQRFQGLRSLVLDNAWQDPSAMHESLAMSVFRLAGQPAPRESYCRLYINNVYQGLYLLVEPIDGAFAGAAFSDPNGYLYEYQYVSAFYGEDLGDDLTAYKQRFQPQTHELDPDATLYSPLRELFREINADDDAVWRERVDARIDLRQFVAMAAIETYLAENDALLGYAGMNNFYLYRGTANARFRVLPWDRDFSFTFLTSSVLRSADENILLARALRQEDLREHYFDVMLAVADLTSADDWLLNEINRRVTMISAAIREDTRKQFSNDDFDAAVEFLRTFAAERPAFVRQEIANNR